MLTSVEVQTSQGSLLNLTLQDSSSGFLIEKIEGLDPVKATLVSSSFARLDGQQYHSSKREMRNLKFLINLEPDYISESVQDLRKLLYVFFMPKSEITLTFTQSDGSTAVIKGRVESFETALFSKEPAVDISILCFDPDFYNPTPVELSEMTTDLSGEIPIEYEGTIETGILFTLNVDRDLAEFTFYHRPPDGSLRSLEFATPLVAGDVLEISTVPGAKGVTLTRAGVDSSVLYAISPYSNWIEFQPGENNIRVYAEGAAIPYDIEYTEKYGGL